jgi:hypothetical protein
MCLDLVADGLALAIVQNVLLVLARGGVCELVHKFDTLSHLQFQYQQVSRQSRGSL